jgi:hypothetical protein
MIVLEAYWSIEPIALNTTKRGKLNLRWWFPFLAEMVRDIKFRKLNHNITQQTALRSLSKA